MSTGAVTLLQRSAVSRIVDDAIDEALSGVTKNAVTAEQVADQITQQLGQMPPGVTLDQVTGRVADGISQHAHATDPHGDRAYADQIGSAADAHADQVGAAANTHADQVAATARDAAVAQSVPRAGGTMTGPLLLSGAPTNAVHATTRAWVLEQVDALRGGVSQADRDSIFELANLLTNDETKLAQVTAALSTKQDKDDDLVAIAGLSTQDFGRQLLTLASAAALRGVLGLGAAATLNVGTTAGTVAAGDDLRLTAQTPQVHKVRTAYPAGTLVTKYGRIWRAVSDLPGTRNFFQLSDWAPQTLPTSPARLVSSSGLNLLAYGGTGYSDGTITGQNSDTFLPVWVDAGVVQFVFPNFAYTNGVVDLTSPDTWTLSSAYARIGAAGTPVRITFNGGQTSVTVTPDTKVIRSDRIYIGADAGSTVYVRCYQTCASGAKFCLFGVSGADGSNVSRKSASVGETDKSATADTTGFTLGGFIYGPVAIESVDAPSGLTKTGITQWGDSLVFRVGWLRRVVVNRMGLPFHDFARIGDNGIYYPAGAKGRTLLAPGGTRIAVVEYGRNDLGACNSLADILAHNRPAWAMARRAGAEIVAVTTLTPATTSTDGWATAAGQTPGNKEDIRLAYNDWVRNNTGGEIDFCLDIAPAAQDPNNPRIFVTTGTAGDVTSDGLHFSDKQADKIADYIEPQVRTLYAMAA